MITLEGALFFALVTPVVIFGSLEVSQAFDQKFEAQIAAIQATCPSQ